MLKSEWMSVFRSRINASLIHFGISALIAALAAILVLGVWFPYPYREVSGGSELFFLIVTVDLILGPLLTFVVFNRLKPRKELIRDLSTIAIIQLAALAYGLHTVYLARPIYLVHEVDRFKVVTLAEIDLEDLPKALPQFRSIPLYGIETIGVRRSRSNEEMFSSINSALAGKDVSAMPARWQPLDDANRAQIRRVAKEVDFLRSRAKDGGKEMDDLINSVGLIPADVIALPLMSHRDDWSVLLDRRDLRIIGYVPIDGF